MKADSRPHTFAFIAVSACFFLSGFAALLYQIAWMRQISTVFGTSELAVATVLAAYMGGLAAGAAVAARMMHRIRRPILVYGVLEAVIAISAIAVPFLLQLAGLVYAWMFGGLEQPPDASGLGQSMFYLAVTFLVLAIPTGCMGATLPMVTRYAVHKDEDVGPRVGLLYSINTVGAIAGTLVAAFLLLPAFGLWGTILTGVAINLAVFGIAAMLAKSTSADSSHAGESKAAQSGLRLAPGVVDSSNHVVIRGRDFLLRSSVDSSALTYSRRQCHRFRDHVGELFVWHCAWQRRCLPNRKNQGDFAAGLHYC